jgi:uncharacterized protein YuzE
MTAIQNVKKYTKLAEFLGDHEDIWISFDNEADVIYVSFEKPMRADDSEMVEDDIVVRTRDEDVIGITLLNGSKWMDKNDEGINE